MMNTANNRMTTVALNGYKDDAIKILTTQINMLSNIESDILIKEENSKNYDTKSDGILSPEKCKEFKQLLTGEVHKLRNFDVVLAVVGTMKAGKSTTINAIVGREILPNRNRPMTSLPTLICHNKEQTTPKLTFNSKPINNFLVDVKNALGVCDIKNPNPEIIELITFIQDKRLFNDTYHGETDIFDFLQRLNDLVRLTTDINTIAGNEILSFPYASYQNIDALPMIDVAFKLQDNFETNGRFMLLDTAGPNEAGQQELIGLLREQLKRSSAVMLVLDYTQLNSEAEESIKNEIEAIPTIQKSRLFALVNKFDQESANADDAATTKTYIFNNLLKDKIELEHIYPISARDAYLANRMESYLLENKEKPDYKEGTWIEDFAKQVLGKRAEKKYEKMDEEDIFEELKALVDESLMSEPLAEVIQKMQKNAPYIAIESALSGASDVFEKLHNFFNIRGHFANREKMNAEEISELEETIKTLHEQIRILQSMSSQIRHSFEYAKKNAFKKLEKEEESRKIYETIKNSLDIIFDNHNEVDTDNDKRKTGLMARLFSNNKNSDDRLKQAKSAAKSNHETLAFSQKSYFDDFQSAVQEKIDELIEGINQQYKEILNNSIDDTKNFTKEIYIKCNDTLSNIQEEFNKEGIKEIKIENINNTVLRNEENIRDKLSLGEKFSSRKRTVHDSGFFGGAKRMLGGFFDKDWGTYEVEEISYTIKKTHVVNNINNLLIKNVAAPLKYQISKTLDDLLQKNIRSIDSFNLTIENIVVEMENAITQEKMPDLEGKRLYKKKIKDLQRLSQNIEEDWEKLSDIFTVEKIDTQVKADVAA